MIILRKGLFTAKGRPVRNYKNSIVNSNEMHQAMILLTSGIYVAVNLLIDVAYTLLDPRIRY